MNKVTFDGDKVLVNGEHVAEMDGRGEVYIRMKDAAGNFVVVSRFKYMRPKAGAKHWLKFILARMSSADIVDRLTNREFPNRVTPLGLAEELGGYKSLNEIYAEKQKAKMAADNARFAHDNRSSQQTRILQMTQPLIKYKWSISVPDEAAGVQQQWSGEANAWDMQNAAEVILAVENASELFRLAGLDPADIVANTKPELPGIMMLSFTEAGRVVSLCIRPHEEHYAS